MIGSTAPCAVEWCERPVGDGYVCQRCADRLTRDLGDIAALWDELDTVLVKQSRYSDPQRGGEEALPFNPTASEIGWVLRNTINTWCRLIAEERGRQLPLDQPAAVADWLTDHVTWLRHHRAGHEAVEEITSAVREVRKVALWSPTERVYAGPCLECGEDLYGRLGDTSVVCRECGSLHDVAEMQEWMRAEVASRLVTAREATVLLGRLGRQVQQKTIDKWFERKRLAGRGLDAAGKRLYLFADLDQLTEATGNTPSGEAAS